MRKGNGSRVGRLKGGVRSGKGREFEEDTERRDGKEGRGGGSKRGVMFNNCLRLVI